MSWKINFVTDDPENEKSVDLDDLSPDVFDNIARNEPNGSWFEVYSFPGGTFERMYRVICAAADQAGLPHPDRSRTMKEAESLVGMLERTPDVEDQSMEDGFPPEPDVTEVGSSSGAPGNSTGPQMSSEDNPSETS